MSDMGHKRTSPSLALMSACYAEPVVVGPKADSRSLRFGVVGRADLGFEDEMVVASAIKDIAVRLLYLNCGVQEKNEPRASQ